MSIFNAKGEVDCGPRSELDCVQAIQDSMTRLGAKLQVLQDGIQSARQAVCTHSWIQTGEGRHGSDAGTEYYTCSLCQQRVGTYYHHITDRRFRYGIVEDS